jgi:hypothetical protein
MLIIRKTFCIFITSVALAALCLPALPTLGEEGTENRESEGKILKYEVTGEGFIMPRNTEEANELREQRQQKFVEGTGAYFGFTSSLEPWDFLDLNLPYPKGAWKTVFPYYFGVNPQLNIPFWIEGTTVIFDNTGNLITREYQVHEPNWESYGTAWCCMGNISRAWEDWMEEAIEVEKPYIGEGNAGIRYFLTQVHLGGVVGGQRMKALLEQVRAKEVSIQRTYRDERYGVFYIPPTSDEWDNWIAEFYVWINMKNWCIERHQVDFLYGREYCQYYNQLWDIQPNESLFYLEWLPTRILDMLDEQYHLTISEEPPPGPDEYIEKDQYVHIEGSTDTEGNPEEKEANDEG